VGLLDEHLVALDWLLLVNQLESIKVIFCSMYSLADIVDIVSNELHVVQSKHFARGLKTTCEPIQYSGNYDGNDGEDVGDIY